jgi:hypothetical protein
MIGGGQPRRGQQHESIHFPADGTSIERRPRRRSRAKDRTHVGP